MTLDTYIFTIKYLNLYIIETVTPILSTVFSRAVLDKVLKFWHLQTIQIN